MHFELGLTLESTEEFVKKSITKCSTYHLNQYIGQGPISGLFLFKVVHVCVCVHVHVPMKVRRECQIP